MRFQRIKVEPGGGQKAVNVQTEHRPWSAFLRGVVLVRSV